MDLQEIYRFISEDLPKIAQAILMIVGALKVLSRYTPMKWDDHLFDKVELPLQWLLKKPEKSEASEPPEQGGDDEPKSAA